MSVDKDRIEKKIAEMASKNPPSKWRENLEYDKKNWEWLKMSSNVAFAVLEVLDHTNMSQVELANKMNVSRQQISRILRGQENLTIETISKLQTALGIKLGRILDGEEIKLKAITAKVAHRNGRHKVKRREKVK
jgi:ribosome-binding protein aMBF1 (putative translation factor)